MPAFNSDFQGFFVKLSGCVCVSSPIANQSRCQKKEASSTNLQKKAEHTQKAEHQWFVALPPPIGSKNPCSYRYLGKKTSCLQRTSLTRRPFQPPHLCTNFRLEFAQI